MKRQFVMVMIVFSFILSSLNWAGAEGLQQEEKSAFILPLSLIEIEEEGFSGTNVQTVVFPEGFMTLQDGVFEHALKLRRVYLPSSTAYIAESAFPKKADLTICGAERSYAQEWAERHQYSFVPSETGQLPTGSGKKTGDYRGEDAFFYRTSIPASMIFLIPLSKTKNRSRRPQDRPELNPIDYRFP